jgi:hypothetical protein
MLLPLTAEQHDDLEERALARAVTSLKLERALLETVEALRAVGVQPIVLKGQALSYTAYDDPTEREAGDVDLLVIDGIGDAARALTSLGLTRVLPELRQGFDDRFGKEVMLVRSDGFEVDLHRTLVLGPAGFTVNTAALAAGAETFEIGGQPLRALSPEHALLHACLVAAYADDPPRLVTLRDIAQLLLVRGVDVDIVLSTAKAWTVVAALAAGVQRAWAELRLEMAHPLVEFASAYIPTPRERLIERSYHGPARSYTSQAASMFVLPTMGDRFEYARALLFPSESYRQARGWKRGEHWAIARRLLKKRENDS